jgi:hypothetical protein
MAIVRAQLVDVSLTRWYPRAYLTKTRGNSRGTGSVGTTEGVNPSRSGRQTSIDTHVARLFIRRYPHALRVLSAPRYPGTSCQL